MSQDQSRRDGPPATAPDLPSDGTDPRERGDADSTLKGGGAVIPEAGTTISPARPAGAQTPDHRGDLADGSEGSATGSRTER